MLSLLFGLMNKEEDKPTQDLLIDGEWLPSADEFLRLCRGQRYTYNSLSNIEPEEIIFSHRAIDDNFTYDDMLDHYCDAVDKLKYNGEVAGCRVTVSYHNDVTDGDYTTVQLVFCDSSGQPIEMNDRDYFVLNNARSLDTRFLQFMKGRSEAYFTPTIQEIVQRMKK